MSSIGNVEWPIVSTRSSLPPTDVAARFFDFGVIFTADLTPETPAGSAVDSNGNVAEPAHFLSGAKTPFAVLALRRPFPFLSN